jgi:hypothetical protein
MSRQPQYDAHQFQNHGRFLKNSGLSFNDFERMHVQRAGDTQPERRLPTPDWSLDDKKTREVIVVYLEERFYTTRHRTGTLLDRMRLCRLAAEAYLPGKKAKLESWIRDYRTISAGGFSELSDEEAQTKFASLSENDGQAALTPEIAREALKSKKLYDLSLQISNLDTDTFMAQRGYAEIVAAIIYLYHRLGWPSPSVAEQLNLRAPHCRQILFRLNESAKALYGNSSQSAADIGVGVKSQAQAQDCRAELNATTGVVTGVPAADSNSSLEPLFQCYTN